MITKKKLKGNRKTLSVTFKHAARKDADAVELLGDFNKWTPGSHEMKQRKDGSWSVTVRLPRNENFQFRYLVDGAAWATDEESDGLAPNEFGGENALLNT